MKRDKPEHIRETYNILSILPEIMEKHHMQILK